MSNPVEDYNDFLRISSSNGWKAFEAELNRQISVYESMMDNDVASGDLLKNYQLIKKGLKIAQNIPNTLETRAKNNMPKGGK